jgi:hypothetical protein
MATELARMSQIIGTTADWGANNIVILEGEIAIELLVGGDVQAKIGDGVTTYSLLPYSWGVGVDLTTDQTINGVKTFNDPILIANLTNPAQTGQLGAIEFFNVHTLALDSKEIGSSAVMIGRGAAGESYGVTASFDGLLYYRGVPIADENGLIGVDGSKQSFGVVNGTNGSILGGSGDFSVVRAQLGVYTVTLNNAAPSQYEQSLTANAQSVFFPMTAQTTVDSSTQWTVVTARTDTGATEDANQWNFIRVTA